MSSSSMSPTSASESAEGQQSSTNTTPPASPTQNKALKSRTDGHNDKDDGNIVKEENKMDFDEDDDDEMDHKSKALTNLLKTSSVFVAIMADKMKEEQKRSQEQARRAAARKKTAEAKATSQQDKDQVRKSARAANQASKEGEEDQASSQQKASQDAPNGTQQEPKGRGRPKKSAGTSNATKSISQYFGKDAAKIEAEGPSVQEALAEAADEYEGEGLGAQDLVATEQPKLVTGGKMRKYQLEGLEWLKSLWMNGLCGILADEMGLGKTIQTISMIAFFKENNISGPFLVAAPLSTVRNWIEEFKFWTPEINTVLYHGSKDDRETMRRKRMKIQDQHKFEFPVVVTSYEICMNDKKFLGNYQWRYIVVDEGHRLKNMNCRLIKELMTYNSANRLLITGTPLQNNIAELWSLLHFLLPEVFNDLDSFERWFDFSSVLDDKNDSDGKSKKRKNNLVGTMHAILKPFLLRRVKTDVESTLPKKREYILYAPLTREQKELYREILEGTSRAYLEAKAAERIEAKSRTASLKRKPNDSGRSTPAKSIKHSRDTTPGSVMSAASTTRRGRKQQRMSYKDVTDREFNAKLRRLEKGQEEVEDDASMEDADTTPQDLSSEEAEEQERAQTLKLAKKEISSKKLQNPVMQARLACNSPHNFYWPFGPTTRSEEESGDFPAVDESLVKASGKMLLLDTLLPRLFKLNHKVLIFSQFKTTLDILEVYATELRGWQTCRIDGSISQEDRYEQITNFNRDSSFKLFLLSTRAGGQGINLTAADTVILFDSDWNPQQDLQAMDRAHRIGQTRPVIVYRLATRGTVEEALLLKADSKRKLEKLVIQKGKFKSLLDTSALSNSDAEELRNILAGDDFERLDVAHPSESEDEDDEAVSENDSRRRTTRSGQNTPSKSKSTPRKKKKQPKPILTEQELAILTDRTDAAYDRAEKGIDVGGAGAAFKVAETKHGAGQEGDVLKDLTTRSK